MGSPARARVVIANRSDGGVAHWSLKLYGFAACTIAASLALTGVLVYWHFASKAPPPPDLERYSEVVPAVSRIYAVDGTVLGEFAEEWRELAPYDEIPEPLIDAFLAIEDHRFFDHHGIDLTGIARAAWRNLSAGDFAQGGSTITQQVAKQFLGSEKSLTRKAKEAIVARRLEARYSKQAILSVYLNQIYLGYGAYGVRAAALRYFGKRLSELDLGEMATIAGLAQAPSRYSPVTHPERAVERRNVVLERMAEHGFISAEEAETWKTAELSVKPARDVFGTIMPYYAEHLRRYVIDKYGHERLMNGGLVIEAAADPVYEAAAYENNIFGARKQDKRQGWRGPEAHLDGPAREVFLERARELYGSPDELEPGKRYLALVEKVAPRSAEVRIGGNSYQLPLRHMNWATRWQVRPAVNDEILDNARRALSEGDVVWVKRPMPVTESFRDWRLDGPNPRWNPRIRERGLETFQKRNAGTVELEQVSHPQMALFTGDHRNNYVLSIVGGTDFARSEYNRATQACRQPGSTYKPIYYSAALDRGFGYDTTLNDIPRAEIDPVTGEVWTPDNFDGTVDNKVTLEYAMVFSKNVPSVDIFKRVGAANVEKWARRLGFTTEIIADQALALGASCTVLPELTGAFAVFARNGKKVDWAYARRILDRSGEILEDNTVFSDPYLSPADRLDRLAKTAGVRPEQAIPARTGYLTSKLLATTIQFGFSWVIRQTGIVAAGKTGTSSATMDMLFIAYTSRIIVGAWMGDDLRKRPLGRDDAAYMTVEPLWARYVNEVAADHPAEEIPWEIPEGTGKRDRGDNKGAESGPMSLVWRKAARSQDPAGTDG